MTIPVIPAFLTELEEAFNQAMVSNDAELIACCTTEDWILVTPEAGPIARHRLLELIASGVLQHFTMTKTATHAWVSDDVAWVTGRGQNTGSFHGQPIQADEYITDVYRKVGGQWKCMLTHLTPVGAVAPHMVQATPLHPFPSPSP